MKKVPTKILLGITGSIAAYKTAELVRLLKKADYDVRVVMTKSATEIITPMTLQVLSQHKVRVNLFDHEDEAKIDHIELARWADQIIIAPATANFMAKFAVGLADDLLSTLCLATDVPIAIAPAMNRLMWENPATQTNVQTLLSRNIELLEPQAGEQACGEVGVGRMLEPVAIVKWLQEKQEQPLQQQLLTGKNIVITAGATRERIDPVRFISNDSSGKMGYALAEQAKKLGANVTLISGITNLAKPSGVTVIDVESARDMYESVMSAVDTLHPQDWFIATAAVADYRVAEIATQKMKKQGDEGLTLQLVQNPDILQSVCNLPNKPFCIGFAAETENVIEYAKAKRLRKGADIIIANDVANTDIGFNSSNNAVTLIGDNLCKDFPIMDKTILAEKLLLAIATYNNQLTK